MSDRPPKMGEELKSVLLALAVVAVTLVCRYLVFLIVPFNGLSEGDFDVSGEEAARYCPVYAHMPGVKVIRARHVEAIDSGTTTIQLELPAGRLGEFLAGSPFRDVRLQSNSIPDGFLEWMPWGRYEALKKSKAFSACGLTEGWPQHEILVDRTNSSTFVVYLSSSS